MSLSPGLRLPLALVGSLLAMAACPAPEDAGPSGYGPPYGHGGNGTGGSGSGGTGGAAGAGAGGGGTGGAQGGAGGGGLGGIGGLPGHAGAGGGQQLTGSLVLEGSGFVAIPDGSRFEARPRLRSTQAGLSTGSGTVTGGLFTVELPGALLPGEDTLIDWYIDEDRSSTCGPTELAGHLEVAGTNQTVTRQLAPGPRDAAACNVFGGVVTYDVTLDGTGFAAYDSQTIRATLVDEVSFVVGGRSSAEVVGGSLTLTLTDAAENTRDNALHYFVDLDGNNYCDDPEEPHWRIAVPAPSADVVLNATPTDPAPSACRNF